jgi:uncharacterized protein YdaT
VARTRSSPPTTHFPLPTSHLMPWTLDRYPPAMTRLPEAVREKAIEIANALLAEGMEEGRAIRIAIARAKEWARNAGLYD